MIRLNYKLFTASAIAFVAITGFKAPEQSAFAKPPESVPVAAAPEKTSGFTALQGIVAKTKSDVETGNFTKAKAEFSQFNDAWKKVQDGLKKKSPDAYKAIEADAATVTKELSASKPDKAKVTTALTTLDKAITKAAK
ncbi:hypothetical protein Syn7502_01692 [Synechococcus sp. PCC 7502]|uniref:hypothetical protein n=1 Tax=Synechococcus sp. PCC 7502 TaxID=1173263 RepID=UPI00029F8763|nr:hypothetical protein [Synechococcus sp. PCC 7502]AFY73746.1 hypothetical protein Syn7502_01692 [Synechococcus sp. PCC 7502]